MGTNRRNQLQQQVDERNVNSGLSHFENNNKGGSNNVRIASNVYTTENGRKRHGSKGNNSNSRSINNNINMLNPDANASLAGNNNFYINRDQQHSSTGSMKYLSEQDQAIVQQVQLQEEILHQQKIQQEKLIKELRLKYPKQMAQYEQQQFIIQQQYFIEQQQARLNMVIQSQLQQHQGQQQNNGNASINNNDHMTLATNSNNNNANSNDVKDINDLNANSGLSTNNSNVNDINFVNNVVAADNDNHVVRNMNEKSKDTTTPVKKDNRAKRVGSVFKAQELAFDMATSLFDD